MADSKGNVSTNTSSPPSPNSFPRSWPGRLSNHPDRFEFFSNPDISDECDPDLMLSVPYSEYISASKLCFFKISYIVTLEAYYKLKFTWRILSSLDVKPDIFGITKTKLNEFSTSNVDNESYNFFHKDSPTKAGGAALHVSNNL